jgi:hypothetical protein
VSLLKIALRGRICDFCILKARRLGDSGMAASESKSKPVKNQKGILVVILCG